MTDWRDGGIPLLTVAEAAEFAGVNQRTISRWISCGLVPAIPNGAQRLVREDHLSRVVIDRALSGDRRRRRRATPLA